MKLKAISLKQPWANLVMKGLKTIETRTWRTNYRGDLVICSSSKPAEENVYPAVDRNPMGYALGIVKLIDIKRMNKSDERYAMCPVYDKAQAWFLDNIREFKKPIPIKGQLNIFDIEIPDEMIKFK